MGRKEDGPPINEEKKIEYNFRIERPNKLPLICEKVSPWINSPFMKLENTYLEIENERTGRTSIITYKELYINANEISEIKPIDPPWTSD